MMKTICEKYEDIVNLICNFFAGRGIQIICFVLYKIIVDIIYIFCIGPGSSFGIIGNVWKIIIGYMMVAVLSFFFNKLLETENASSILLIIIYMIYFVPITTYCGWGPGSSGTLFFMFVYALLLTFLEIKIPVYHIQMSTNSKTVKAILSVSFYILFAAVGILILYISYEYTGFRIITSLNEVYQYRAEAAQYDMPGWLSRLQSFCNILIPMLILMAFIRKKILFVLLGGVFFILNFSYAGHKSIFFMGLILFVGYFFWRKGMNHLFLPAGCMLGVIGLVEYFFSAHAYIVGWFFRRQGYTLAQLSDYYYQFFGENPTDIFRSTFLGKVGFSSPYSLPISKVIGNNYFTQTVNSNNGLLSDVWSHLGIIGIIIMPIILVICFRLFDMASSGLSTRYIVGLAAYYAVSFCNSTWSTVLLTHGYLIMCIGFFIFPRCNLKK